MAEIVQIMDFAADEVVIEFWVGEANHFVAVPDIPLGMMQKIVHMRDIEKTVQKDGKLDAIYEVFDELLDERSAALFRECVDKKIIGIGRLMRILPWLLEKYGLGPTQPSKPSSTGLSDDAIGSSSEDGASASASPTSPDFVPSTPST